ncbi:MAG: class I SAM-dependent methyltransferase [Pseudorhodoferax sp.]
MTEMPAQLTQDSLLDLWHSTGKHGVYQQLPAFLVRDFGVTAPVDERWRGDRTRLDYLRTRIDFHGLRVVDIGANTGFFSLTLAHDDAAQVTAVEPDPANSAFLRAVAQHYGLGQMQTSSTPVTLDTVAALPASDLVLLLNVLHHAGDDFDRRHVPEPGALAAYMTEYLSRLARTTERMVFQLGYNWCGNKATPVFPGVREPYAMLDYLEPVMQGAGWVIESAALRFDVDDPRMVEISPDPRRPALQTPSEELLAQPGVQELLGARALTRVSEFYARPLLICRKAG